jgi:large subunit ribosomal protein L9
MEVILREDIESLGNAGDVVKVKDGYARNFLLPQNKAVLANQKNIRMLDHQKRVVASHQEKLKKSAEGIAEKLRDFSVTIVREAGEEDKLFGSVTKRDVLALIKEQGIEIDRHALKLDGPIKKLGNYTIPIRLHADVVAEMSLRIVRESTE